MLTAKQKSEKAAKEFAEICELWAETKGHADLEWRADQSIAFERFAKNNADLILSALRSYAPAESFKRDERSEA